MNRKRWLRVLLVGLLALPLVAAGAVLLGLRSASIRRAILERVATAVEEATRVRATATDFSLDLTQGVLEVHNLTLAAGDASPFVRAERVRVAFDWTDLVGDPLRLQSVFVQGPVVDLDAPLPEATGEDEEAAGGGLEIADFRLAEGQILGAGSGDPWLREWSAGAIDLHGSLRDGRVEAGLRRARLRLVRDEAPPELAAIELEVRAQVNGPLSGPFTVESLRLTGPGLELAASGEVGTGAGDPLAVRLDLDLAPAELLPDLAPGGRLTARGALDLRRWIGHLHLVAEDFPAAALEPWIGEAARPGGRASYLDLTADLASDPGAPQQVTAEADLVWRRGAEKLLTARLTVTDGRVSAEDGIDPESLAGEVHAVARELPADFLRPWLGAETLEMLGGPGSRLDLNADFAVATAAVERPTGRAEIVWHRAGERLLEATARTLDLGPGASILGLGFTAALLPAAPGHRRLTGELVAPSWAQIADGTLRQTTLELALPDVAATAGDGRRLWPRLVPEASAEWPLSGSVAVTANIHGPLLAPEVDLELTGEPEAGTRVVLAATGHPLAQQGSGRLTIENFDLSRLHEELFGKLLAVVDASGSGEEWEAQIVVDGTGLGYGTDLPAIDALHLEATTDLRRFVLTTLTAAVGDARLEAGGSGDLLPPIRRADLRATVEQPMTGIERADLQARVGDGVLYLERLTVDSPAGRGHLSAELPLGPLRSLLGAVLAADPWPADLLVEMAEGTASAEFDLPLVDLAALFRLLGRERPWPIHTTGLSGRLELDPAALVASRGEIIFSHWTLASEKYRALMAEPFRLELGDRRLRIHPLRIEAAGHLLDLEGSVELAPDWQLGDPPAELVRNLRIEADGTVDTAFFNPYLEGGVAAGPLVVRAKAAGSLEQLVADLHLSGPEASLRFSSPYVTEISAPEIDLVVADGTLTLRSGQLALNQGTVYLEGQRSSAGDLDLRFLLNGVRYHVDYGLSFVLAGSLRFSQPAEGRGLIAGNLEVESGLLRRRLDLEREILGLLFAPAELSGTAADPLEEIDLALTVTTADGVRVRNNVADLRAVWSSLEVGGTVALPTLRGQIDLEPGGLIFAYGQTTRIDQGTLILTGDPTAAPELELVTTTSLEDPTIGERDRFSWLSPVESRERARELEAGREQTEAVASGLADYLGGRLTERLSAGGRTRLGAEWIFGETNPGGRLTIASDLSSSVAFGASFDLRDTRNQTYLLQLHELRGLPQLTTKVFTTDAHGEGVSVQQSLEFGGGPSLDPSQPRLRKVFFTAPEELPERRLRRAVGFARGDRLPAGAASDVEVDVADFLRRRGYPGARVDVELVPRGRDEADLQIAVDPGPHVVFEFTGDSPPVALRRAITAYYRVDFYEPTSRAEMEVETVRALRSQGYLHPEATALPPAVNDAGDEWTVIVEAHGGQRVRLREVVFAGVPAADVEYLNARFESQVARVELAAEVPAAHERLVAILRSLGYPEPRIASQSISEDGERLTVTLEPGRRLLLSTVRIVGPEPALVAELEARIGAEPLRVRAAEPPRAGNVAAANALIREVLERRGYAEAEVRSILGPAADDPEQLTLTFEVNPGPQYRIVGVAFTGLRFTRPGWAWRVIRIGDDALLDPERLGQARRELFGTQLFRRVRARTERSPDGTAAVTFDLEEEPRFAVAWGVRWESDEGQAAIVDAVDRNFLGRGFTLGLRALYGDDLRVARLYLGRANLFGRRTAVELFVERRQETQLEGTEVIETIDSLEGTLQLSFPLWQATSRIYGRFREEVFRIHLEDFIDEIRTRSPFVGWQLLYDRRDDQVLPTRGFFASTDLSTTGDYLGTDLHFVRLFGQLLYFRSAGGIAGRRLTWAQSYRVGLFHSRDEFPLRSELFLAGGEYSLRGYPTDDLGPPDPILGAAGGQALLVVNQELRFPIWREFSGLVFLDVGNVWAERSDFGSDLVTAVGLGLRAETPLGLLRCDVGYPLDRREDDPAYKVYFGFGHAF